MSKPKKETSVWIEVRKKDLPKISDQLSMAIISIKNKTPIAHFRELLDFEKKIFEVSQKNE